MWPLSIVGPPQFEFDVVAVVVAVVDEGWLRLMLDVAQFIEVADAANAAGEDDVVIVKFFMGSDIMEAWKKRMQ